MQTYAIVETRVIAVHGQSAEEALALYRDKGAEVELGEIVERRTSLVLPAPITLEAFTLRAIADAAAPGVEPWQETGS